jgi:hypothetical protein
MDASRLRRSGNHKPLAYRVYGSPVVALTSEYIVLVAPVALLLDTVSAD